MVDVVIRELADFPQWIPTISSWFHDEWHELLGVRSLEEIEQGLAKWLVRDAIPTALVAVIGEEVVGTVALRAREFEQFGETPWLAGLYVVPPYRKAGIGMQLLRAAEKKAVAMGIHKLYLYTPRAQRFYQTLGWQARQEATLYTKPVTIMEKVLLPHNLFQAPPVPARG
ncbi:MAG: GNAT family N-acetyltransferase [Burkholderiaceae bacterium]|nr:GNAT family N-acetyltransferase [Burkholderiaceae bacterium]